MEGRWLTGRWRSWKSKLTPDSSYGLGRDSRAVEDAVRNAYSARHKPVRFRSHNLPPQILASHVHYL